MLRSWSGFFSSRRRHTRWTGDWSSDVCSSDLRSGVNGVGICARGLDVPDALELPGMRRVVVPAVRAWGALVLELVAYRFPRLAAVVRALHHLSEPAARLRRV